MAKQKRKIVKPTYIAKAERAKKQPRKPLSKGVIFGTIGGVAALVLVIVLLNVISNIGTLPVKDGEVQKEAGWIVTNLSESGKKYYKLGEAEPIEGFTERDETIKTDKNETDFWFYPDSEESQIKSYTISGVRNTPKQMIELVHPTFVSMYGEENVSEAKTATIAGREASYFTSVTESELESGEKQRLQTFCAYLPAPRNASVLINVSLHVTDELPAMADEALLSLAEEIAGHIAFADAK